MVQSDYPLLTSALIRPTTRQKFYSVHSFTSISIIAYAAWRAYQGISTLSGFSTTNVALRALAVGLDHSTQRIAGGCWRKLTSVVGIPNYAIILSRTDTLLLLRLASGFVQGEHTQPWFINPFDAFVSSYYFRLVSGLPSASIHLIQLGRSGSQTHNGTFLSLRRR